MNNRKTQMFQGTKRVVNEGVKKVKDTSLIKRWFSKTPKIWLGIFRIAGVIGIGAGTVLLGAPTFGLVIPAGIATILGWMALGSSTLAAMAKAIREDDAIANPLDFVKKFIGLKKN